MDIEDWRRQIDELDAAIVETLNRRMRCSLEIGKIKRNQGLPIYAPEREASILDRVVSLSTGPLGGAALRRVFQQIIEESRGLEQERSE